MLNSALSAVTSHDLEFLVQFVQSSSDSCPTGSFSNQTKALKSLQVGEAMDRRLNSSLWLWENRSEKIAQRIGRETFEHYSWKPFVNAAEVTTPSQTLCHPIAKPRACSGTAVLCSACLPLFHISSILQSSRMS